MATTEAIVTYRDSKTTLVRTKREKACEGCADQSSCLEAQNGCQTDTRVLNSVGAEKGDEVLLSYDSKSLLRITFLVYLFPIIFLIVGAVIGDNLSKELNLSDSFSAALFAFLFFLGALIIIKLYNNKIEKREECLATVLKILKKGNK